MDRHQQVARMFANYGANGAIDDAISKIKRKLDHGEEWTAAQRMEAFTNVYNMSLNRPEVVRELCEKFKSAAKERISEKVIPSLENVKEASALVRQLAEEWTLHKRFTKYLVFVFYSLDYHLGRTVPQPLPLPDVSLICFCDMVWDRFHSSIEMAIRDLIASGWVHEEKPDLPSYTQLSDFIKLIDQTRNVHLLN